MKMGSSSMRVKPAPLVKVLEKGRVIGRTVKRAKEQEEAQGEGKGVARRVMVEGGNIKLT